MSDLISRSELLKRFLVTKDGHRMPEKDCDNFEITVSIKDIKRIIREQPTAYGIDKVVEELETKENEAILKAPNTSDLQNPDYQKWMMKSYGFKEAIEIVKQGGVYDDVCEWRLCDEEANVYDTSCRNPHILIEGTPKENNYEYCPYCGKKIKVVE